MEHPTSQTIPSSPEKDISSLGHLHQEDSVQATKNIPTNELPESSLVRAPPPSLATITTPTLPMVHRLVLKHRSSGISQNSTTQEEEEEDDDSDCFELESGENWLRLVPKQAGRHSILDDTQDASDVGLIYPSILSLASLGEDVTISDECYLCLDVDGGTLAVKDMRPFEPSGSRRKRSTKKQGPLALVSNQSSANQKPSLGISRVQQPATPSALSATTGTGESIILRRGPWERLPRRQLRILRHGDQICTSFQSSQSCGSEGGLVLEYQYQLKSTKTERVSLGLLTQPMEEDSDVEATPTVDGSDSPASGVKQSGTNCKEPLVGQTWESKNTTQDEVSVADSDQTEEMGLTAMPSTTIQKLSLCTQPQEEEDNNDEEKPPKEPEPSTLPVDIQVAEPNKDSEEKETVKASKTESGSQTLVAPSNEEKHPEQIDKPAETPDKKPLETVIMEPLNPSMLLAPPKTPVQIVTLLPPSDNVDDVDMPESALTMTQALMCSPAVLAAKTTAAIADDPKLIIETKVVPSAPVADAKVTAVEPSSGDVTSKDNNEHSEKEIELGEKSNMSPKRQANKMEENDKPVAVQNEKKPDNNRQHMPTMAAETNAVPCEHVGVPQAEEDFPQSAITMTQALLPKTVDEPQQVYSQEISSTMLRETGEDTPRDGNDDSSELTEVDEPSARKLPTESGGETASKVAPISDHHDEDSVITDIEENPEKVDAAASNKEPTLGTQEDNQEDDQEEIPSETTKEVGEHAKAEEFVDEETQPLHLKENPKQVDLEAESDTEKAQSQRENPPDPVPGLDAMVEEDDEDVEAPEYQKVSDVQGGGERPSAVEVKSTRKRENDESMVDDSSKQQMSTRRLRKKSPAAKEEGDEVSDDRAASDKQTTHPVPEPNEESENEGVAAEQNRTPVSSLRKRRREQKTASADDGTTPLATRRSKRSRKEEHEEEVATPTPRTSSRRRRTSGSVLEDLPTPRSDTVEASPYQQGTDSNPALRVMATGIAFAAKKKNLVKRIGGVFIENLNDAASANYLIAASDDVPLKRTPKLMVALCRTRNIVHLNWLEDSAKMREPLDPSPYLLLNEGRAEEQYNFLMHVSLERADYLRQRGHSLFGGLSFFLCKGVAGCKDAKNRTPPEDDFAIILEAAGGKLSKSLPSKNHSCREVVVIVSKIESEAKKQLANARVAAAIKKGASHKTTEDIFHAIMDQKFCL